jgi:HAD superfamily hydrolase (TIGR01509 family)
VCDVFAHRPAARIAAELRAWTGTAGGSVPAGDEGPHDVLGWAAGVSAGLAREVEERLRLAELDAVATADATPGAGAFLAACRASGRTVAVVSNNNADAINAYLERTGLVRYVSHVEGRDPSDPALMKPHPYLLGAALRALGASPDRSVFVGDATSDVQAGAAAGVPTVGYARAAAERDRLTAAGAAAVTDSMAALAAVLPCRVWIS